MIRLMSLWCVLIGSRTERFHYLGRYKASIIQKRRLWRKLLVRSLFFYDEINKPKHYLF